MPFFSHPIITSSPLPPNRRFSSNTGLQAERQVNPPLRAKQSLHEHWSHEVEENKCSCDKSFLQFIAASGEAIMSSDIWKTNGKYEMFASYMITLQLLCKENCVHLFTQISYLLHNVCEDVSMVKTRHWWMNSLMSLALLSKRPVNASQLLFGLPFIKSGKN